MRSHRRTPTGIRVRHSRSCATSHGQQRCSCSPGYEAFVYSPADGKKIRRVFPTLAAARSWRHDSATAVRRGAMRAPTATTLREAWEAWIVAARRGEIRNRNRRAYKPAALRSYDNDMKLYVLSGYGARRLADIRADDLQHLIDLLVGTGLSGSRVRNVIVPLQALYRRHRREVPVNPTRDLDLPEAGGVREWHGTPAEAHQKVAALPVGERALWATAFFAGLRRGELRALRVSDVHGLEEGTEAYIDIVRSWDDKEGEIAPKSSAGTRRVPLPEALHKVLAEHVDRAERSGDDFVFGATGRSPFSPSYVRATATELGRSPESLASLSTSAGTVTPASSTLPGSARLGLIAT
jgi:integrase